MNDDRREGGRGPVAPDRINGIRIDWRKSCAGRKASLVEPFNRFRSVKPRIETYPLVARQILRQPGGGRRFRDVLQVENGAVDLRRRLHRVPSVDEQGGAIAKDNRKSRGSRKSGQPKQPLFRRRHVLVLVLVRPRNQEAPKVALLELMPKRLDPFG